MVTLLTQQVAIVMQSTIIIEALKIVTVVMFAVCRLYVHRDANTFSLNDTFHVRVANYTL
jgi:type IV secretory pathway VirB3-like protein